MEGEESWDFSLVFSEKCTSEEVKGYVIDCLKRKNLEVRQEVHEGQTLLSVRAPFDVLAQKVGAK